MIYLDHAATTPLLPTVKQHLKALIDQDLGNPSALHTYGQHSRQLIESARVSVAQLINAAPAEIIFTSGGTESNNTVINTFAGQHITVSDIEHPSVLESAKAKTNQLTILPVDRWGRINPADISHDSSLISIMMANNELGTLEPIREVVNKFQSPHTFIHTDATQAVGKVPIDVQDLGVNYLSFSAHKIGGPLGVGVLYVKTGSPFAPLIYGGHQEEKRRAGTSNVLAISGFGVAAQQTYQDQTWRQYQSVKELRDSLRDQILSKIPYSSANTPESGSLPNILNMSFQAAEGESIQLYLDLAGVAVSTGSACAAGDIQPSHVLMATRHDAEVAHSSIRFSLGLDTTEADIAQVMYELPSIIKKLQDISTIKVGEHHD